jgi:Family of unknown function (DUF5906)
MAVRGSHERREAACLPFAGKREQRMDVNHEANTVLSENVAGSAIPAALEPRTFVVEYLTSSKLYELVTSPANDATSASWRIQIASALKHLSKADETWNWPGLLRVDARVVFEELFPAAVAAWELASERPLGFDRWGFGELWTTIGAEYTDKQTLSAAIKARWLEAKDEESVAAATRIQWIVWVRRLEKFICRLPDGTYDFCSPASREAALAHLMTHAEMSGRSARKLINSCAYAKVDTLDVNPSATQTFDDSRGLKCLNSYTRPELHPAEGSWPRIFEILWMITGAEGAEARAGDASSGERAGSAMTWLFNWIAAQIRHPERRGLVSPLLVGPQGCGKTAMGEFVRQMVGLHNSTSISGKDLADTFTGRYAGALFVNVNEVHVSADRQDILDKIKNLQTEEEITFSVPHAARIPIKNRLSFWLTSNNPAALRLEGVDERRHSVFVARADLCSKGTEYWATVKDMFDPRTQELRPDALSELQAFYASLLAWEVDWHAATTPFENDARRALVETTRLPHEAFFDAVNDQTDSTGACALIEELWQRWRARGEHRGEPCGVSEADTQDGVPFAVLYGAYRQFCLDQGSDRPLGTPRFSGEWRHRFGGRFPVRKRTKKENRVLVCWGLHINSTWSKAHQAGLAIVAGGARLPLGAK